MAVEELSLSTVTTVPVNWLAHRAFSPDAEPGPVERAPQTALSATERLERSRRASEVCICIGGILGTLSGLVFLVIGILR